MVTARLLHRKLCAALLGMASFSASATICLDMSWVVLNLETEKDIHYTPYTPTKTRMPHYTLAPIWRNAEGWVKVKAEIDQDGNIQNAMVLDSNATPVMERASLRAMEQWQYPAAENAVNDASQGKAVVEFGFKNVRTRPLVARMFDVRYARADGMIKDNQLDDALEQIEILEKLTERLTLSTSRLIYDGLINHLYSRYFQAKGDPVRRQVHLDYAYRETNHFAVELREMIALELMQASAQVGAYDRVVDVYYDMFHDIESNHGQDALALYQRVVETKENETELARNIWVSNAGVAYHVINRKHFSLTHADSPLSSVRVACGDQITELSIQKGQFASIPQRWGQCLLTVEGEPDSTLSIVEFDSYDEALAFIRS